MNTYYIKNDDVLNVATIISQNYSKALKELNNTLNDDTPNSKVTITYIY